ncbi:MAG: winged helix-turn-helix transcriptional regulator [Acidimicrobiaceae bacterium]|jgi:DNA-binding MarR family transcriptional regulator|nr:winged helix-turn-helix transcriptional regulator [Acidimicrobiaceae bacterium]
MTSTPRWLSPEQLRAWKDLSLMQLQLQARLSRGLAEYGLSYQDYLVLATLSDQPDGRRRVVELSDELGWEKSRLSHHITRMCERGLLTKSPCPSDQRGIFVMLSDSGRTTLENAAPAHVGDVQRYFFDQLSPAQVEALANIAGEVLTNLSAAQTVV